MELGLDKIQRETNEDFYSFSISPQYKNKDFRAYLKFQRIQYKRDEDKEKDFEKNTILFKNKFI